MSRETVINNMVTFLIAGHETTSGTLSFLFYHLLKNPKKYMAVQEEVDRVIGDKPLEPKHLSQLVYIKFAVYEGQHEGYSVLSFTTKVFQRFDSWAPSL